MMRLKIIALTCLLTIALPVEAEDPIIPPFPEDPSDQEAWLLFIDELGNRVGVCKEDIPLPPSHDNVAAIQKFASEAPHKISVSDKSTLELRTVDHRYASSGVRLTFQWSLQNPSC